MHAMNPNWHWKEYKEVAPHYPGPKRTDDTLARYAGSRLIGRKKTIGSLACLREGDVAALLHANIKTVDDLTRVTRERLLAIGIPRYIINEIRDILHARGLKSLLPF